MEYSYLPRLNRPNDIKKFGEEELRKIAEEARHKITEVVYKNGGHLGSNLGVVDLTLALHYVFDITKDLIVWDGSYQTYTHKLLTGRRDRFHTLRTYGGLCGFGWKPESEHDPFNFGHVGTGLAAAYGACQADQILKRDRKVVAIVGDGSLTCGVAYEALNNIGSSKLPLLVIVNDNGFSIAKTVGAISKYFNELRTVPLFTEIKKEIHKILEKMPMGKTVEEAMDRVRKGVMQTIFPNIFTAFGFQYYGPIDGHDIPGLITLLRNVRHMPGPVLLHVVTKKGCGHPDADTDPFGLHKPVEPKTGSLSGSPSLSANKIEPGNAPAPMAKRSYTRAFIDHLIATAHKDPSVVGITAAMPDGTGLLEFGKVFPNRMFDVGISEQCAVGFAAGLSQSGARPVVAIYSQFIQRAFDIIFQEGCLNKLPMLLVLDRAGIAGEDGPTHHGMFDIAYLRTFPEIFLMAPKDEEELKAMMDLGLRLDRPTAIRLPRENCPDLSRFGVKGMRPLKLGEGEVLFEGKDGMILAYGVMTAKALEARESLKEEGIDVGVANARFAKPIDQELVEQLLARHRWVLTVEDHSYLGGFGSAVLEAASLKGAAAQKLKILAAPDRFIDHGARDLLLDLLCLDARGIAKACRLLAENPKAASEALLVSELIASNATTRPSVDPFAAF
jgi:1-deoxy-D-xylulose-5-phosphate synthase